ncbi:MAG: hypothetical protein LAQ30_30300 [Acidobacteriia bacterium]|nr:hypothetical protein [Terriglobia bacterium]
MPTRAECPAERRAESRSRASGRICLRSPDLAARVICGELRDVSPHGFRAAHDCPGLASGQIVWLEQDGAARRARVVWTRIAAGLVESGFCYLAA